MSTVKERVLISCIGDEDTVTGLLLSGIGHIDSKQRQNFLVVDSKTVLAKIEETFLDFVNRRDIAIILINQHVADDIRGLIDEHVAAFPTVLEIPSKDHPYEWSTGSCLVQAEIEGGEMEVGSLCLRSQSDRRQVISMAPKRQKLSANRDSPSMQECSSTDSESKWQVVINTAVKSIVSIRFSQVSTFDCDAAVTSEATGFVIDSKSGFILTNRHVTCAGPFTGVGVFHDHEEVDVIPIYRDPIHDFGFLKFNPKEIKYQEVSHITLSPESARVGLDIRVVGNDAGEKLSILAGSISRLDRNAPDYGEMNYNDFNTFYLQAASSTSGGSSGSPVLDSQGRAVALQAGGHTRAATDFFFPLDRVKRAFSFLQKGLPVPRGTIQVQWLHRPFDEVRRLGLSEECEERIRSLYPDEIGMLVAEVVVPDGPGSLFLEEGDVLVQLMGKSVTQFVPLEEVFDDHVGGEVVMIVQRGGVEMEFCIFVQDLHTLAPDRFASYGGGKFHDISYQLARQYAIPVKGVFIFENSGIWKFDAGPGWIIQSVDSKPTATLEDFIRVVSSLPDRERVPCTYYSITDIHSLAITIITIDRHWSDFTLAVRNDTTGLWDFTPLGPQSPLPPRVLKPTRAIHAKLDTSLGKCRHLFRSIVKISYYMPHRLDGFPRSKKRGAGLVVDSKLGIVVVGRNTVPFEMGDCYMTIADSVVIPARVCFMHPTQNISFLKYDPNLLHPDTDIETPVFGNADDELVQGHSVWLVALNMHQRPVCIETRITDVSGCTIPINLNPRFRAVNFDGITLDTPLAQQCSFGVLCDGNAIVRGLWLSFLGERTNNGTDNEYHLGIQLASIAQCMTKLPDFPVFKGFPCEITGIKLSQARQMGLSPEWIQKVEVGNPQRPQVFMVARKEIGATNYLKELDLLLSVNGETISHINDLEPREDWSDSVQMTIIREKKELVVQVLTSLLRDQRDRIVCFAGAVIQEPHRAALQQSKLVPSRVYVVTRSKGSPSYMYGINPTSWITHVNGVETLTLDDFIEAIRGLADNTYVRIKILSYDFVPAIISVKLVLHYWPSIIYQRDADSEIGWTKEVLSPATPEATLLQVGNVDAAEPCGDDVEEMGDD